MAFRTDGLGKAYSKAQSEAIRLKSYASQASASLAAATTSGNAVIQIMTTLKSSIEVFDSVSSLPGIAAYAQDDENDPAYDVVAEFTAMRNAAVSARDWIINNFPVSNPGGFLEKDTVAADGSITVRQFTPGQTAGLQTELTALANTITVV
jgi:hypothetical protein